MTQAGGLGTRFHQLVRVESCSAESIRVVIPGWDPLTEVVIQRSTLPREIDMPMIEHAYKQRRGKAVCRLYAVVDLAAKTAEDLKPSDWAWK